MATLTYIDAPALADAVRAGPSSGIIVVDVRDEDFYGGNIVGAVNAPSEDWMEPAFVQQLIEKLEVDSSKTVVFHCMKSQVRGPTCARAFAEKVAFLPAESRPTM
jgi:rhodanese-related sulfurtransferase